MVPFLDAKNPMVPLKFRIHGIAYVLQITGGKGTQFFVITEEDSHPETYYSQGLGSMKPSPEDFPDVIFSLNTATVAILLLFRYLMWPCMGNIWIEQALKCKEILLFLFLLYLQCPVFDTTQCMLQQEHNWYSVFDAIIVMFNRGGPSI